MREYLGTLIKPLIKIKQDFLEFNTLPPERKAHLLSTLNKLKTTGLPEAIKQSLSYLTIDLDELSNDMLLEIKDHLSESDIKSLIISVMLLIVELTLCSGIYTLDFLAG